MRNKLNLANMDDYLFVSNNFKLEISINFLSSNEIKKPDYHSFKSRKV